MTRLFRVDLADLPDVIDARTGVAAPEAWVQAPVRPADGHWIAPLGDDGAVPEGAAALSLTGRATLPPAAHGLPVYVATPAAIPDDHPGPIVVMHLASYPCAADRLVATLDRMDADPRLCLETSGACIGNFIQIAAARHPDRVLFGSGAPDFDPLAQRDHVAAALTDDAVLAAVLHGNAGRLLGRGA